ncbi:MAG: SRPBCC domain-containing protein [Acidobacteria bacterium]|nr:SRPBCC domain-containing protein [Acidobacteriota bacterium]
MTAGPTYCNSIPIDAPASAVWAFLTTPSLIQRWMWDSPLEIHCGWTTGSPLVLRGNLHGMPFTNKGEVMTIEPERLLQYTQWSTLTGCADVPENYCLLTFHLAEQAPRHTILTLTQTRFFSEASYKHYELYWNVTLPFLRRLVEESLPGQPSM